MLSYHIIYRFIICFSSYSCHRYIKIIIYFRFFIPNTNNSSFFCTFKVFVPCISHAKHIFNANTEFTRQIYSRFIGYYHTFFQDCFTSRRYNGRFVDIKSYTVTGCMTEIFSVTVFRDYISCNFIDIRTFCSGFYAVEYSKLSF